jgi:hypothetical protein
MNELSSGTKGAMAELRVSIHLMGLGFHVARMLSPNSPTDLYAAKGRRILRVQVKSTLSLNQLKNLRNGAYDLLAVLVNGELHYHALDRHPDLLEWVDLLRKVHERRIQILAFANNHYAGFGPATVKLFWDLWNKK